MCLDKSKWTGSKVFSDTATGWGSGSCDSYLAVPTDSDTGVKVFSNFGFGAGKKRWADVSSSLDFTPSQRAVLKMEGFATNCCDGKTIVDHPGHAYSPSPTTTYHPGPAYSPSPSTTNVAEATLVDMVKRLQQEVESLRRQLAEPQKYLCEVATKFCAPGTKWIDGNCVATFDGIVSACENARPGWEWTCKGAQHCTT